MFAIVVFVVMVLVFDWLRRRAQSRGGVWCGVGVDVVWGFGCVVVDVVFVAACSGG